MLNSVIVFNVVGTIIIVGKNWEELNVYLLLIRHRAYLKRLRGFLFTFMFRPELDLEVELDFAAFNKIQ